MEVQRTLEKKGIWHRLKIAKEGEEAFLMLNDGNGVFNGKPDLVLVDFEFAKDELL